MPKEWTGNLVGLMHNHRISFAQLAEKLNVTNRYVSMVMNGHREPVGAEQRFTAAVDELIKEKGRGTSCSTSTKGREER